MRVPYLRAVLRGCHRERLGENGHRRVPRALRGVRAQHRASVALVTANRARRPPNIRSSVRDVLCCVHSVLCKARLQEVDEGHPCALSVDREHAEAPQQASRGRLLASRLHGVRHVLVPHQLRAHLAPTLRIDSQRMNESVRVEWPGRWHRDRRRPCERRGRSKDRKQGGDLP